MCYNVNAAFELKFLAESGTFEGYASVFHVTDSMNDTIAPGAFRASLEHWQAEGRFPPMLWQHDVKQPIGAWQDMREDEHGLYVSGRLFVDEIARAREAYKLLKENVVTGLSIGYRTKQAHTDRETGTRVLTQIDLIEISMVTFPANDMARVALVKSALSEGRVPSLREFEAFLREAGFSRKQAKGILAQGYKSLGFPLRDAMEPDQEDLKGIRALTEKLWQLSQP